MSLVGRQYAYYICCVRILVIGDHKAHMFAILNVWWWWLIKVGETPRRCALPNAPCAVLPATTTSGSLGIRNIVFFCTYVYIHLPSLAMAQMNLFTRKWHLVGETNIPCARKFNESVIMSNELTSTHINHHVGSFHICNCLLLFYFKYNFS